MTPLLSIACTVVVLATAGCGGDHVGKPPPASAKPRGPVPHALTEGQVISVRLGTSLKTVLERLGSPSGTGPQTVGRDRCLYWQIVGQSPTKALWRLCFRSNRLDVISTYLV
jgi:hypothetical protein